MITGWIRALQEMYGLGVKPTFIKTMGACRLGFYEVHGGFGMSLDLLLYSTRRFQATDPREKIIALMGLAKNVGPRASRSIVPDYSKSTVDLYRDMTGRVIKEENSLCLLSTAEDNSDGKMLSLPSWVPDYSLGQRATIIGFPIIQLKYQAASLDPMTARWTTASNVLGLQGRCEDVIKIVSSKAS